jgi:arylsulfatase A-like enzyme
MKSPPKLLSVALTALLIAPAVAAQSSTQTNSTPSRPGTGAVPRPESRRPNVLVILCDQFNARMLGHEDNGYGGLSQSLTPNLDTLAAGGVRFTNAACTSAVCQASRYSILTGRWPYNHGVRVNSIWEPRTETVFPELAKGAGYYTAQIGLQHLFWLNQAPGWGDEHGLDEVIDFIDYGAFLAANNAPPWSAPANTVLMPNLPAHGTFEVTGYTLSSNKFHPAGYWAHEVIRFLRDRAGPGGDGKPFLCRYSMLGPHTPVLPSGVPPDDWAHLYHPFGQLPLPPNLNKVPTTVRLTNSQANFASVTDDQWREALSYYYGLVSQLDWNIGRVLDELERLGLADDTLVVFTADHGEMASEMRCWTKGAGSYDALTRVPLIMRLPGVLPAGRAISEPVINIDLFPTLVEATGVPIDEPVRAAVDGVSLLELMLDPTTPAGWRQESFHAFGTSALFAKHHFMVRTPTAKYTLDELDGAEEFYDLAADPFEITDLFFDPDPGIQAQIADLQGRLNGFWNGEAGHAPHYSLIGAWSAAPVPPTAPVPAHTATAVARDVDPSWLPCTGAAVQDVYFGTSAGSLSPVASLGHMESSFNPGTLAPATTYYWRVDQTNGNGTALGAVWSFTTQSRGNGGPGLARSPSPLHRAREVPLGQTLAWTAGPGVLWQDLRFGSEGQLQLVATGVPFTTTTWDPGPLQAGVTYEWRVDGQDASGVTVGDVWSFEVSRAGLAARAEPVSPGHLQAAVPDGSVLVWQSGAGAESHDVYFGTSFPLAFQGNQRARWFDPGPLVAGETYYWRIDELNQAGRTMGWTSRFTK